MAPSVFHSRIDGWLAGVIGVGSIVAFVAAVVMVPGAAPAQLLGAAALALVGAGLPLWVLLGTRYTFAGAELRVVSGPFRWRIPVRSIRQVTPTRNPLSSPALSLDRLRIDYADGKWLMVSPRDKDAFVRELDARRAGQLTR